MIDFIKTKNIELPNPEILEWEFTTNQTTGEIRPVEVAEYNGLKFKRKSGKIFLSGSLHRYFNEGQHNYNDFHYNDLKNVLNDIKTRFKLNLDTTEIENVEVGINLVIPYSPDKVINSLVLHRGQPFCKFPKGRGVECSHAQYYIKVYDKGLQFKLSENVLRLEIKVIKMQFLQSQNIPLRTLNDLLNTDILQGLGELLTRTIEEIIWTDSKLLNSKKVPDKYRLLLANGSNPLYWINLKPERTDPDYSRKRKSYYRELARFEKIISKYGNELKPEILTKSRDKFTDLLTKIRQIGHVKKRDKFTEPQHPAGTNLPCRYSVRLSHVKKCPVTGLDISMQRSTSKFLCITGIKFYYQNEPTIYRQLESKLSDKWKQRPLKIRYREIAHYIRNEYNNPRHNYTRDTKKRGAKLFDDTPYYSERLKNSMYGKVC